MTIIQIKCGVLIQKKNRLLLIRERNSIDGQYYWNIIKGSFEPQKDKNIFNTAKREAWEEARAKIHLKNLFKIFIVHDSYRVLIQFNFMADLIGSSFRLAKPAKQYKYRRGEDIKDIRLFSKKELKKINKKEFISERTYLSVKEWLKNNKKGLKNLNLIKIINNNQNSNNYK